MAAKVLNLASYDRLLTKIHPQVPHTAEENERLLASVKELMAKETLSPEESALMDLLVLLIENFEEEHYRIGRAKPHDVLKEIMRARDVKPKDLYDIFGSRGTTSEVLSGKRGVSKSAAKALSKKFGVSVELFL